MSRGQHAINRQRYLRPWTVEGQSYRRLTDEFSIGHDIWVKLDPQGLSMVRGT